MCFDPVGVPAGDLLDEAGEEGDTRSGRGLLRFKNPLLKPLKAPRGEAAELELGLQFLTCGFAFKQTSSRTMYDLLFAISEPCPRCRRCCSYVIVTFLIV